MEVMGLFEHIRSPKSACEESVSLSKLLQFRSTTRVENTPISTVLQRQTWVWYGLIAHSDVFWKQYKSINWGYLHQGFLIRYFPSAKALGSVGAARRRYVVMAASTGYSFWSICHWDSHEVQWRWTVMAHGLKLLQLIGYKVMKPVINVKGHDCKMICNVKVLVAAILTTDVNMCYLETG